MGVELVTRAVQVKIHIKLQSKTLKGQGRYRHRWQDNIKMDEVKEMV
jgi:hypothetical protein